MGERTGRHRQARLDVRCVTTRHNRRCALLWVDLDEPGRPLHCRPVGARTGCALITWPATSPGTIHPVACPVCWRRLDLDVAATRDHLIEQSEGLPAPPTVRVLLASDVVTYP